MKKKKEREKRLSSSVPEADYTLSLGNLLQSKKAEMDTFILVVGFFCIMCT